MVFTLTLYISGLHRRCSGQQEGKKSEKLYVIENYQVKNGILKKTFVYGIYMIHE